MYFLAKKPSYYVLPGNDYVLPGNDYVLPGNSKPSKQ